MSNSRYAVLQSLYELKSVDAIIGCRRHGAPRCFPSTTLIRLYELLRNDSRTFERTRQQAQGLLTNALNQLYGGGERDRTDDPLLAKQVLSQLSYTPLCVVGLVGFEPTTPALSRRCSNRLSYRPSRQVICRQQQPISVSA